MACTKPESIWRLAAGQHGVVSRGQLLDRGLTRSGIEHRLARGRLFKVRHSVYAVGRAQLSREGIWMSAVLSCGEGATLSHDTAAAHWRLRHDTGRIEVSTPDDRRPTGVTVHRYKELEVVEHRGIPVTSPVSTLVDLAARLSRDELEAAINAADRLDLVDPEGLRSSLDRFGRRAGVARMRATLDQRTFTLTDSILERHFLPIARRAGLSRPLTGQIINGYKIDFYWPELGLVVETDGLRYHRTPAQQAKDAVRDQAHTAAGLTPLRFPRAQVVFQPNSVEETLARVARRLCATLSA
jgi:very-short-patch-repair endonuclease